MLKGNKKDVTRISTDTNEAYVSADISQAYALIKETGTAWRLELITRRATVGELAKVKALFPGSVFDCYSTGGGFYTSECRYRGLVYAVENDTPYILSVYREQPEEEDIFMPENMIESFDVNQKPLNDHIRLIYEMLLKKMSE